MVEKHRDRYNPSFMDENLINPLVSVIMPAYNAELFIRESIESVIKQTYSNWELIIINDGSTDDTKSIVEEYVLRDHRIRLINQLNKRLGAARNTGFKNATGFLLAFLDSDDLWLPGKLEIQINYFRQNPQIDVLFSNGYTFLENKKVKIDYHLPNVQGIFSGNEMYARLFIDNEIPVLSVLMKSKWIEIVGLQDEVTKGSEDLDYWLKLAKANAQFCGIADKLFIYRVHDAGMSAQYLAQKFSTLNILYTNFDPTIVDLEKRKKVFLRFSDLVKKFKVEGNKTDSDLSATELYSIYNDLGIRVLTKMLGKPKGIITYLQIKKGIKLFFSFSFLKFLLKKISKVILNLFFKLYQVFDNYSSRLNVRYHKWKYANNLQINGYFNLSKKSNLEIDSSEARLISYGLFLGDFSTIKLSGKSELFISKASIYKYCNFNIWNSSVTIGNNVLFNNYCSLNCLGKIEIGDNTWFGEGVRLYDHNHKFKDKKMPFTEQGFSIGEIKIGANCWIGANTVILQNVVIEDNCVIGANNLIYKSVPANTIVKAKTMELMEPIAS